MALSDKQRVFVEEYLATWNASEAARRAEYAKPGQQGHRLLKNVEISAEIERRVAEKTLTADEVLVRLAEHARGSLGEFVRFDEQGHIVFDLQAAALLGKMNLVKKLKTKTRTYTTATVTVTQGGTEADEDSQEEGQVGIGDVEVTEVLVEFELYDAQSALVHIGKHHKLFADRVEMTGKDGKDLNTLTEVHVYLPDNQRDGDSRAD